MWYNAITCNIFELKKLVNGNGVFELCKGICLFRDLGLGAPNQEKVVREKMIFNFGR